MRFNGKIDILRTDPFESSTSLDTTINLFALVGHSSGNEAEQATFDILHILSFCTSAARD